ncbi:VapC toxin family PIN domain ribonuclease [bacterium]|nr:VapC toxin family PIN domain ribonuclease [bacterium]
MVRLLDANLLIALAWPVHVHYEAARAWFGLHRDEGWATCSFTEAAFVRISSNPRVFASATTPAQALLALQILRKLPGHSFLEDHATLTDSPFQSMIVHHQQVTDAHLLTLAHLHRVKLSTFDKGIDRLVPAGFPNSEFLETLVP